jgi:hypothetical protein
MSIGHIVESAGCFIHPDRRDLVEAFVPRTGARTHCLWSPMVVLPLLHKTLAKDPTLLDPLPRKPALAHQTVYLLLADAEIRCNLPRRNEVGARHECLAECGRFCTNCQPNRPLMHICPCPTLWSKGEVTFTVCLIVEDVRGQRLVPRLAAGRY